MYSSVWTLVKKPYLSEKMNYRLDWIFRFFIDIFLQFVNVNYYKYTHVL